MVAASAFFNVVPNHDSATAKSLDDEYAHGEPACGVCTSGRCIRTA